MSSSPVQSSPVQSAKSPFLSLFNFPLAVQPQSRPPGQPALPFFPISVNASRTCSDPVILYDTIDTNNLVIFPSLCSVDLGRRFASEQHHRQERDRRASEAPAAPWPSSLPLSLGPRLTPLPPEHPHGTPPSSTPRPLQPSAPRSGLQVPPRGTNVNTTPQPPRRPHEIIASQQHGCYRRCKDEAGLQGRCHRYCHRRRRRRRQQAKVTDAPPVTNRFVSSLSSLSSLAAFLLFSLSFSFVDSSHAGPQMLTVPSRVLHLQVTTEEVR